MLHWIGILVGEGIVAAHHVHVAGHHGVARLMIPHTTLLPDLLLATLVNHLVFHVVEDFLEVH